MRDCAVLLTTFGRPTLVRDAIQSVLQQDCDRWHLFVLDDGCADDARAAIATACGVSVWTYEQEVAGGIATTNQERSITWWRGPRREMAERKKAISYSSTINIALNYLLRDELYVCYLPDDDSLYPEAVRSRAEYLDAHPDVHVVYGRMRSIQYGADGSRNTWASSGKPETGLSFPRPTGPRVQVGGGGKRCYFQSPDRWGQPTDERDPDTGNLWVEEGYFEEGPLTYGVEGSTDHGQVLHRIECLLSCGINFPRKPDGAIEYWGEALSHGVGDACFFRLLGSAHKFIGVKAWCNVKKFHGMNDRPEAGESRE